MSSAASSPWSPPPPAMNDSGSLAHYAAAAASLRDALDELDDSPSFLVVTSDEPGPATAARLGDAPDVASRLWSWITALQQAVDELAGIDVDARPQELTDGLTRAWIPDPDDPSTRITMAELARRARDGFDTVRAQVAAIDQAWRTVLPDMDAARLTIDRLRAEAEALGVVEPLLGRAESMCADLRQRLVADPLSVAVDEGSVLVATVGEAANELARARTGHDGLVGDLAGAAQQLAVLRALRARAEAAGELAVEKVVGDLEVVRVPSIDVLDGPGGLSARLDDVLGRTDQLDWPQQRALLDAWKRLADRLQYQLEESEQTTRRPLARRDELRGRLAAYRVKVAAAGRAEDQATGALVDEIRHELFTAPSDLDAAETTLE
ncbi:MAG: hypothetical protein ACK5PP_14865, partial [Acidimicrobiales bacterium]